MDSRAKPNSEEDIWEILSIPLNGFRRGFESVTATMRLSIPLNGFLQMARGPATGGNHSTFNSTEWIRISISLSALSAASSSLSIPLNGFFILANVSWMPSSPLRPFNSTEWILHHRVPCSLWKALSFPLRGFYSIKLPGGGSMYMVWGRVFKLYALIPH